MLPAGVDGLRVRLGRLAWGRVSDCDGVPCGAVLWTSLVGKRAALKCPRVGYSQVTRGPYRYVDRLAFSFTGATIPVLSAERRTGMSFADCTDSPIS